MRITIPMTPNVFAYPMGAVLVAFEYANRLAARGHSVVLAYARPTDAEGNPTAVPGAPDLDRAPRVDWFETDARVVSQWFDLRDLETLPDADILFNAPASYDVRKGHRVSMVQGFGVAPPEVEDAAFRLPGLKLAASRWVCDELRARGVPEAEIAHVPNGVDTSVFRITSAVAERPPRIAMLHHFLPWKGTDLGIAALEKVKVSRPDAEAIFFGVTPRASDIPVWVEYRRLPGREELVELYNSAAVLICPSRTDAFYLCGVEAMACGCALVANDIGGVRDYAEAGVTALVAPREDSSALADRVLALLADQKLRLRIAGAGHERARAFDWELCTDRLVERLQDWLRSPTSSV